MSLLTGGPEWRAEDDQGQGEQGAEQKASAHPARSSNTKAWSAARRLKLRHPSGVAADQLRAR